MQDPQAKKKFVNLIVFIFLSILIFILDISLPIGYVGGILYIIPLMIYFWFPKVRYYFVLFFFLTVLVIVAPFWKPESSSLEQLPVPLFNRSILIISVWIVIFILYNWNRLQEAIKRNQAALMEKEKRLAKTQEIAKIGSWELDLVPNRLFWSEETYAIFGYDPRAFGASYEAFLDAVHPDDRKAVDEAYSSSLRENRDAYEISHRIVRKATGEIRYVQERCEHTRDASGNIVRSVGMVQDVTEIKKAEEVLNRDKETLERLIAEGSEELMKAYRENEKLKRLSEIGELTAIIAHELRNPITSIGISTYTLRRKIDNPELIKYCINIDKKIIECSQFIDNLLSFSRIKPPSYESFNVYALVRECIEEQIAGREGQKGSLVTACDQLSDTMIEADPFQLKSVIFNIINNAFDASGDSAQITVEGKLSGEDLLLSVADNGPGIDEATMEKIFKPFFTTKAKGTGLGLSICLQIVSLHGGKLAIESKKGEGTVVRITLPLRKPSSRTA